jgi:hypothetical protein
MIRLAICLALALCATGCGNEIRSCASTDAGPARDEPFRICNSLEPDDPELDCASGDQYCKSGGQCASGLTCMEIAPQTPCFTELDGYCQCRPLGFGRLATGSGRLALQHGFAVGGMASAVDTTASPPRLTWQAPAGARYVACALFSCPPSFLKFGCSPTNENELFRIDNFEQCVLLHDAFPATQPGFILGHESAYPGRSRCAASDLGPRVVTELAAGCWAYDTTSVVAATELHPIRGSLLAGIPGLPDDGPCLTDGAACHDAAADVFGVCLGGTCRPRCQRAVDCALADPAPAAGGTCGWTCEEVPGQELGACVPKP